ncbi:tetratricopeptide repeat protein [Ruegeria sediminis]|uniref:Tetratricopeptide repeat protein n=1 Tax=Ruegeria sediminis TaxID=2583820 RepID=A0ABY2X074_9RHOB|nr:tetratricopeptide repeat protein [Ruegeria sediminis]TMV08633.1 tetratricopeptide repeat protein [Ruegeria sediminis]
MNDYYDLGNHHCAVTTASTEAQMWFDQGLAWTYGYNHEEAVACFERALGHDPNCAMAHWGVAYAAGPNYNLPWELLDDSGRAQALAKAYDATQNALALVENVTPVEQALIRALPARYPWRDPIDDMHVWDHDFADAMRAAFALVPDHLDLRTIFVESLLNLTPWQMWDLKAGVPAEGAATVEAQEALEWAMANDPAAMTHPGLLHLYVHLMEMSPTPEKALKAGDVLRTLVPDAGHLVHMPTHIDVLCGHYQNVVHWNEKAIEADLKYFEREGAFNIYTGYRQHNYHFVIYGALFLGQMEPALRANQGIWDTTPEEMLRIESPPMADYFESYMSMGPHILIRFGRWHEAMALDLPDDPDLFRTLTATTHYARAVAFAATGDVTRAEAEEKLFLAAKDRVPETRLLHNNRVVDLLDIATEMLRGEIEYRKGNHDAAFAHLRRSVELDDTLPYDEPWGWMQPTRHALGALLFEQGHLAEAEAVYREDLGLGGNLSRASIHPDNVWSLKGLHDCLKARGEQQEILQIKQRLDLALARADRAVAASCFCAQAAMKAAE